MQFISGLIEKKIYEDCIEFQVQLEKKKNKLLSLIKALTPIESLSSIEAFKVGWSFFIKVLLCFNFWDFKIVDSHHN